jgi:molybdate transport system regulatory protein
MMKLSARNVLKAKVANVVHGPVSTEVTLELTPGVEIVSVITTTSAKNMGLKAGDSAYAIIKSDHVIVGTD